MTGWSNRDGFRAVKFTEKSPCYARLAVVQMILQEVGRECGTVFGLRVQPGGSIDICQLVRTIATKAGLAGLASQNVMRVTVATGTPALVAARIFEMEIFYAV
jgi:hypothetical protein